MPRRCQCCVSPRALEIREALLRGEPCGQIAATYGIGSADAVGRHARHVRGFRSAKQGEAGCPTLPAFFAGGWADFTPCSIRARNQNIATLSFQKWRRQVTSGVAIRNERFLREVALELLSRTPPRGSAGFSQRDTSRAPCTEHSSKPVA